MATTPAWGKTQGVGMLVVEHLPNLGYFTATLVAVAGIAFASGVQYMVIGLWRRREALHLSYAALCFCIAALAVANVYLRTSSEIVGGLWAMRWVIAVAIPFFLPFVVFIRAYTGSATPWRVQLALACLSMVFLWVNWQMPVTLFFSSVWTVPALRLPWGETLYRFGGEVSMWGWAFHLASYVAFGWALWRAVRQYRQGERLPAVMLGTCLGIEFAALLWGDIAVDVFGVRSPYVDTFAFLPFVLLMSLTLMAQLQQRSRQLVYIRERLEVEERTRYAAEQRLRHLAYHDGLTGLANRSRLFDRLGELHAELQAQERHGALLLIDLDNFKTVNDGLGHLVGDRLLQAVAERLRTAAPARSLLARLGGDEFVLLLGPPLPVSLADAQQQARQLAGELIARLAEPVDVDGRALAVGASVGVAAFPDGEADVADLLRRADIALYRAKAAGRGMAKLFEAPMQQEADTRLRLERGLREALDCPPDQPQLALHFQPQVGLDGRLLGAEALLRWRHPVHGDISPERFIPLAEETGLIHALGAWVIAEACAWLKQWEHDGVAFQGRLAVNVSAWQLAHPHFVSRLEEQVRASGVAPEQLVLELTESALLQDFERALAILRRLVAAGFHLALDDFGVGYSSLSYLQRLPVYALKIDRAFVNELTPEASHPLAGFIVDVAHRLGMTVVAEGVETEQQRQALARMGCEALQGYLIARPLAEADFRQWLGGHAQAMQQAG